MTVDRRGSGRRGQPRGRPNKALERTTAGSHSLAPAAHRRRSAGEGSLIPKGKGLMETIRSKDGTPIACRNSGKGPPVLLVHGTTDDGALWEPVLPAMEPHRTVCAMDRRGRGASGDVEAYAFEREWEDIAAVVDTIGGSVDVVAHSFGATCALEATRLTRHVRRLALY